MRARITHIIGFILLLAYAHGVQAVPRSFLFYGAMVEAEVQGALLLGPQLPARVTHLDLEKQLERWGSQQIQGLMASLRSESDVMILDDYGKVRLFMAAAENLLGRNADATLLAWILARYAGFDAILGFGGGVPKLYVRLAFLTEGTMFATWMGKKYTLMQNSGPDWRERETIYLTKHEPSELTQAVFLRMHELPKLGQTTARRHIAFQHQGRKYSIAVPYRKYFVQYLDDLPVIALGNLFLQAPMNAAATALFKDSLQGWTRGMTRMQSLHFLLSLVQEGFTYKRDRDYMAHDKHNFAEQTLAAVYADCEDKAVIFLQLAAQLQFKGVLLYNEAQVHVAAAVELPSHAPGANFIWEGRKYLICEPARYGFKPGETKLPPNAPGRVL